MKKASWFVGVPIVVSALVLSGCIFKQMSEEQAKAVAEVRVELDDLAAKNLDLVKQFQAGTLTVAQFNEAIAANAASVKILESKLQVEGMSKEEVLIWGAAGGTVARTALHGAARFLPIASAIPGLGWLGWLSPILTMVLQSESKKKKVA